MKKRFTLILGLLMIMAVFAGCKSNLPKEEGERTAPPPATQSPAAGTAQEQSTQEPQNNVEEGFRTGLGIVTTFSSSKDASDVDGLAQVDSTVVAVMLDEGGRIMKCIIDGVQSPINFSKTGKLVTDSKTTFKTKDELGDAYGMKKASKIGKEWDEQAEAFAEYAVGRTLEEIKGIDINENGAPADADLSATVTISVGNFIKAIEKAVMNAQTAQITSNDKMGLGIATNMSKSKDAADDEEGLAQAYSTYTLITLDDADRLTSCIIDGSQGSVNFSKTGKISTDLTQYVQTKNELGDDYGLKSASKIGREWNEQAAAFAAYAIGKTAEEIKGIAVNAGGAPADADLAASVTIGIGEFIDVIEKAADHAE